MQQGSVPVTTSHSCMAAYTSGIRIHSVYAQRSARAGAPSLLHTEIYYCGPQKVSDTTAWRVDLNPSWQYQASWIRKWTSSTFRHCAPQAPATSVPWLRKGDGRSRCHMTQSVGFPQAIEGLQSDYKLQGVFPYPSIEPTKCRVDSFRFCLSLDQSVLLNNSEYELSRPQSTRSEC